MAGLYTQLTPEQIKSITDQATQLGQQQGISPEQALYDYAQTQGLSNGAVDTLMGFAPGSTTSWAQQNIPNYQSSNTAPVAQVLTSAPANTPTTTTPAAPAATPATTTPDTSTNLGFGAPATAANPQLAYAPTTPQVDTSYTKNPYLDQMAQDITTAATDSWTRNIDPT